MINETISKDEATDLDLKMGVILIVLGIVLIVAGITLIIC